MNKRLFTLSLVLTALVSLSLLIAVRRYAIDTEPHPASAAMVRAVERTQKAFDLIRNEKIRRGIIAPDDDLRRTFPLLGIEYSEILTTLGSYEAKLASSNHEFSALVVRILSDHGFDSTKRIGVTMSGSFPAIGISVLCALEELGIDPIIISSLGSSSYGANDTAMTWADIELLLYGAGIISHRSVFVTPGADSDTGGGLPEGGIEVIRSAAQRAQSQLFIPESLPSAIAFRESLLVTAGIDMMINIGGNHAVLGNCGHASAFPNGYTDAVRSCFDDERGLLMHIAERGIPVFHFLDIRDLARRNEIEENGIDAERSAMIYTKTKTDTIAVIGSLLLIGVLLVVIRTIKMRLYSYYRP